MATTLTTKDGVKVRWETIDPDRARSLRDQHNPNNRPLRAHAARILADDMEREDWKINGDTLRFDENGDLLDGQHRLDAVVRSGKAQTFLIVEGLKRRTVMPTIDRGDKRSPGHILAMDGFSNATAAAAIARIVLNYKDGKAPNSTVSTTRIVDFADEHDNLRLAAQYGLQCAGVMQPSALGAVLYLGMEDGHHVKAAARFADGISKGEQLASLDPRYLLRERMIRERTHAPGHRSPGLAWTMACAIICWNKYVTAQPMARLNVPSQIKGSDLPLIVGSVSPAETVKN